MVLALPTLPAPAKLKPSAAARCPCPLLVRPCEPGPSVRAGLEAWPLAHAGLWRSCGGGAWVWAGGGELLLRGPALEEEEAADCSGDPRWC